MQGVVLKQGYKFSFIFAGIIFLLNSCHKKDLEFPAHPFYYSDEIHANKLLFSADSLYILKDYTSAEKIYTTILNSKIEDKIKNYVLWRVNKANINDKELIKMYLDYSQNHVETCGILLPEMCLFGLDHGLTPIEINRLRIASDTISNPYYKGIAELCLGRYYEEVTEKLDSSWYYLNSAHQSFKETGVICEYHIQCIEKLTLHSTYKRNNLLAIRYANYLFDYEKHYPVLDSLTKARIFSNRAFVLFREGDIEGTLADVAQGLSCIEKNHDHEIFQNLIKSNLVVATIKNDSSLWKSSNAAIEQSLKNSKDYISFDRWKGQWYYYRGDLVLAEKFTLAALNSEVRNKIRNPARYSSLCYTLSSIYSQREDYENAVKYVKKAENINDQLSIVQVVSHIRKNYAYSYYPALDLAKLYLSIYEKEQKTEALINAQIFTDLVDELLYKQMNTAFEENILTFFEQSGADFFDTGLMIYEQLYSTTKDKKYLLKFLEYSEKRKSSILYRDLYNSKINALLPKEIILKEKKLRFEIKKERAKGFRSNHNFDKLIDEYTLLENEHIKKNKAYFENGLNLASVDFDALLHKTMASKESFLIIDETAKFWYYTYITAGKIVSQKHPVKAPTIEVIQKISALGTNNNDSITFYFNKYSDLILPKGLITTTGHIHFVLDGIYSYLPLKKIFENMGLESGELPSIKWYSPQNKLKNEYAEDAIAVFSFSDLNTIRSKDRTYLPELPGAYKEAMALKKQYPDAKVFTGSEATKENFIKIYQNPKIKYIHLALHGNANSTVKDDIKLYFRTETNGLDSLYGYELLQYQSDCRKVVLAACNSDVGKYVRGEGTYSLPRYFMVNGVVDVVASKAHIQD